MSTGAQHGRGRGVISSLLVLVLASIVLFSRAQLVQSSFEEPLSPTWHGPEGGGAEGGNGDGLVVTLDADDFVRTGEHSIRLRVWDDGSPSALSWAGMMQILPCRAGRKVRVGAWLYCSSSVLPMRGESCAQLKIEYFEDDRAQRLIPTHLFLSPPFNPRTYKPDAWHLIEACDRAPQYARSLKFSVVITAQKLNGEKQAVWLDDMFVEMQPPKPVGASGGDGGKAAAL
ncbi:MAG: hypothetical protein V1873_03655 [Verrucomicrobiota bacterium]